MTLVKNFPLLLDWLVFVSQIGLLIGLILTLALLLNTQIVGQFNKQKVNQRSCLSKSSATRLKNPPKTLLPGYSSDLKALDIDAHGWTATVFTGPALLTGSLSLFAFLSLLYRAAINESIAQQNLSLYTYLAFSGSTLVSVGTLLLTEQLRLHWRDRSSITLAAIPLIKTMLSTNVHDGAWNVRVVKRFIRFKNAWIRLGYPEDDKSLIDLQKLLNDDRRPWLERRDFERLTNEVQAMIGKVYAARSAMISELQKGRTSPPLNKAIIRLLKFTAYTVPVASILQTIRTLFG